MVSLFLRAFRIATTFTGLCLCVMAQSDLGELHLTVTDVSGLGLPSAISLTSGANHFQQHFETSGSGSLIVRRLPFGVYQIQVSSPGFSSVSYTVEIRSSLPGSYHAQLSVAGVNSSIVVNGTPILLDPHSAGSANRVDSQMIAQNTISIPGHSTIDVVNSQPGWLLEANGVLHPRGSEYQVQYVLDGVPLTNNRSPAFSSDIGDSDVESMTILTGSYPAEYGRKLGGVVEIDTRQRQGDGLHGQLVASGGSFDTANGYATLQYGWGRNLFGISSEGGHTDRYLDPPTQQNFTNAGTLVNYASQFERDISEADRITLMLRHSESRFLVPNEVLQEIASQRQNRATAETLGILGYHHIFSPTVLFDFRGMGTDSSARLQSNALSTPIIADQNRGFREGYVKASVAVHTHKHEWKIGIESDFASIREQFNYSISDPGQFDPLTPRRFAYSGTAQDREQGAYVQDFVRLGNWTANLGLRFDHYKLLVRQTAVSPRLAVSRYLRSADIVIHAAYDRAFQTPAFENILLSSSPGVLSLNPQVVRLPLRPSLGNLYEIGVAKAFVHTLRLDANYYRRDFSNFADDDVLLNTGVSFPIAFRKAKIYGAEAKIEVEQSKRFSGYLSYSYMVGFGYLPVTGGLLLGDDVNSSLASGRKFPITQDQRNTLRTRWRYQTCTRMWIALGASFGSGLPTDFAGTPADVSEQYGATTLKHLNLERGRIRPSYAIDFSTGVSLWKRDRWSMQVQGDVQNLTNHFNLTNFTGLFSGTAVAAPRSALLRWTTEF